MKLLCFLRASGGVSTLRFLAADRRRFSPRKRRCFQSVRNRTWSSGVFSAQAEVFLWRTYSTSALSRFLRASGGVSAATATNADKVEFSPRKRRCFYRNRDFSGQSRVFSAQAEVFPSFDGGTLFVAGFLRASGGVSKTVVSMLFQYMFSPRKRRCFYSF